MPNTHCNFPVAPDENVFENVFVTRRMVNDDFMTDIFSREHPIYVVLRNLMNEQYAATTARMWTELQQRSLERQQVRIAASLCARMRCRDQDENSSDDYQLFR